MSFDEMYEPSIRVVAEIREDELEGLVFKEFYIFVGLMDYDLTEEIEQKYPCWFNQIQEWAMQKYIDQRGAA